MLWPDTHLQEALPQELFKPLTMWATSRMAVGKECSKVLALVTFPVQVGTMGEAWDEGVKRSS